MFEQKNYVEAEKLYQIVGEKRSIVTCFVQSGAVQIEGGKLSAEVALRRPLKSTLPKLRLHQLGYRL